jgi:hypothetical protein
VRRSLLELRCVFLIAPLGENKFTERAKLTNPRSIQKVTDDDIHKATEEQCSEDLEFGVEGGTLILSRAVAADDDSTANASYSAPPETAPSCCAICLESYQPGEVVAWSCSCKHVFHQDCIAHYLSKKMFGGETPCPCCRQQFLKWPEDDDPLEPKT